MEQNLGVATAKPDTSELCEVAGSNQDKISFLSETKNRYALEQFHITRLYQKLVSDIPLNLALYQNLISDILPLDETKFIINYIIGFVLYK